MEQTENFMESSNKSPVPEFLHDQLIDDSIGLSRNCDNDLLFQQLPLPEQLLQSDEKDGEDDSSNSVQGGMHKSGLDHNRFDSTEQIADDQEQQNQIKVSNPANKNHCVMIIIFLKKKKRIKIDLWSFSRRRNIAVSVDQHYRKKITEFCPASII